MRMKNNNTEGWRAPQDKKKGVAKHVESGARSTARGWVRPQKASADRDNATLTNVPFSHAAVMKAIFLDLG